VLNADKNVINEGNVVLNNSSFVPVFSKYKVDEAHVEHEISSFNSEKRSIEV